MESHLKISAALALALVALQCSGATTRYVDLNATAGGNTGADWDNAWTNFSQVGWAGMSPGDILEISKGDYASLPPSGYTLTVSNKGVTIWISADPAHNGHVYLQGIKLQTSCSNTVVNGALDRTLPTSGIIVSNLWSITNNIGLHVTNSTISHGYYAGDKAANGSQLLWTEIGPVGDDPRTDDTHGLFLDVTTPSSPLLSFEAAYDYVHDVRHGHSYYVRQNSGTLDESQWGIIKFHHDISENTGGDHFHLYSCNDLHDSLMIGSDRTFNFEHMDDIQIGPGNYKKIRVYHNLFREGPASGGQIGYLEFSSYTNHEDFYFYGNIVTFPFTNANQNSLQFIYNDYFSKYDSGYTNIMITNLVVANNLFNTRSNQALSIVIKSNQWVECLHAGITNVYLVNNVFVDCYTNQLASPQFVWFPSDRSDYERAVIDYNSISGNTNFTYGAALNNVPALTAGGVWTHNQTNRPSFVSQATGNFRLLSSDTGIKTLGVDLSTYLPADVYANMPDADKDIDGKRRVGAWDIGPYQYDGVDANLQVWLKFDDDFPTTLFLSDSSGNNRHALDYGRPGFPTNWPSRVTGHSDYAGEFHYYWDGWDLPASGRSGDYGAITNLGPLLNLTQATFSVWAYYYTAYENTIGNDHNATLLDAGYATKGTWHFGRYYSSSYAQTEFFIATNAASGFWYLPNTYGPHIHGWPEDYVTGHTSDKGNSRGWHHYAVTVDCTSGDAVVKGYFQGTNFSAATCTDMPYLTVQTPTSGDLDNRYPWIAVGCWTHNGSAPMEEGDEYPNNGWLSGAMDDIRIYDRVLSDSEIAALAGLGQYVTPSANAQSMRVGLLQGR